MVADMNAKGSKPYVIITKGGGKGDETVLTNAGRKILEKFEKLEDDVLVVIENHKVVETGLITGAKMNVVVAYLSTTFMVEPNKV